MNRPEKRRRIPAETPPPTAKALKEARILRTQSRREHADYLGSYTGTAADDDIPEQDADDL